MKYRPPERLVDHLHNVLVAIERIERYLEKHDQASFLENDLIQDAVIRNLEVIGEALHKIEEVDRSFRADHRDLPWDHAYGMRNLLSHGYYRVTPEIVWFTVQESLPILRRQVEAIVKETAGSGDSKQ
jgi:uncharacterized protein with HEPN domain